MSTIDEIKAKLDIVDVVTGYVSTLKRSGRTYKALCPFHNERTPSFAVDSERGTWHCFGACSTGGDVIEFIRRIENLEFPEALRVCAQRAGIELRPTSPREREEQEVNERLIRANEAAAIFFQASLDGPNASHAMTYLDGRGLDRDSRERWQIGFAPDGWRNLLEHLQARGFSEADLLEAGLAVENREDDRSSYDRFRHRIMFPIRDVSNRLVGFGARSLSRDGGTEDDPKYLNTPQTPLFDKSGLLYGVSYAGEPARRADKLVVVEGYMDVIAAHQFGIENVVASMGTAITDKQMSLVKRFTSNVVLALDADTAGSEATLRGVEVAAAAAEKQTLPTIDWGGLVRYQDVLQADIRVITMPDGQDPDSLIRTSPDHFRILLEESRPVTDHLFEVVSSGTDLEDPRSRSRALETLTPTLSAIADPVVRAHYVQRLARLGKVDEQIVLALLNRGKVDRGPRAVPSVAEARRKTRKSITTTPDGETQLLQLVFHRPEARQPGLNLDPDTFEETINRNLFSAWCEFEDLMDRANDLDNDIRERLESIINSIPEALNPDLLDGRYVANMLEDIASQLRDNRARERFRPAAVEQAEKVVMARHEGESVLESASRAIREDSVHEDSDDDSVTLGIDFAQMSTRQRQLKRASTKKSDHQDMNHGTDREEQADDTADV